MKLLFNVILYLLFSCHSYCQMELSTGYAVNKNLADGAAIQVAYDIRVGSRFFTKPQIGYKSLYHYNDFVGATLKVCIKELHETFSYQVIKHYKYIFQPNVGLNYRIYRWQGAMKPPYDVEPMRSWTIGTREGIFKLSNESGETHQTYKANNFGFSIQLQNQFRINSRLWLHITPFMEPDYDGSQNTGGCYVGVIFPAL